VAAKRDELLLRTPSDVEAQDDIREQRIHDEVDRGFDVLRDIDDDVSIFGSAGTSVRFRPRGELHFLPELGSRMAKEPLGSAFG
jgi:hypothetical protein